MKTSKFISIGFILTAAFFLTTCEVQRMGCTDPRAVNYDVSADIDDNTCIYEGDVDDGDCKPHLDGNLSITNLTDEILYLYHDANLGLFKCIPANAEDFIVNIPNGELGIRKLQIWMAKDVTDKDNPDINTVYRQWSVALSNTIAPEERANWIITNSDENNASGTLELSYPALDDYGQEVIYQVDVMLNSKTGAKLASLQPGANAKKVSIDYGAHYLYFRYWYSDPNSSTGEIVELGWLQGEVVVINAEHQVDQIAIPFFYSAVGKFGELLIYNRSTKPLTIYANDALIESIAKVDGSTEGLSIIPASASTKFLIPVNTYTFTAKSIDGSSTVVTFQNIDILQNETAVKEAGITHQTISMLNYTNETLLLYNFNDDYLGSAMASGERSGNFLVPATLDSVKVMTADKSKMKRLHVSEDTIQNLEDYSAVSLDIISPWTYIGNATYQSPDIDDNQTTTMTATLTNNQSVALSFDYKVSSEAGFDSFSFSINGVDHISNQNGEIDWTEFSVDIAPGTHTLVWKYQKDNLQSDGTDNVEIRNISAN